MQQFYFTGLYSMDVIEYVASLHQSDIKGRLSPATFLICDFGHFGWEPRKLLHATQSERWLGPRV